MSRRTRNLYINCVQGDGDPYDDANGVLPHAHQYELDNMVNEGHPENYDRAVNEQYAAQHVLPHAYLYDDGPVSLMIYVRGCIVSS